MSRPTILAVFGTRPEAIKMAPVVHALREHGGFVVRVVVTGQHRELLDQMLATTGLQADVDLDLMEPNQLLDVLAARIVTRLGEVLDKLRPDRILVHGDTLTAMMASLTAYFRRIPVAHVEAGLRSGNIYSPWPEEVSRCVAASVADLHFAPTEAAAAALRAESRRGAIHVTGNTVIDALLAMRERIARQPELTSGLDCLATSFVRRRIVLVTAHRRESFGAGVAGIIAAIVRLARRPDVAIVIPMHLNPQVHAQLEPALDGLANIALIPPLDYPHFIQLMEMAELILTDSGGVQEEAPSLDKPVLVMRDVTERPEGIAAGTARLVGTDPDRIVAEASRLLDDPAAYRAMATAPNPYGDGHAAQRIVDVLANAHVAQRDIGRASDPAFVQAQQSRVAARAGGVDRDRAFGAESVEVMRAAGLGAGA